MTTATTWQPIDKTSLLADDRRNSPVRPPFELAKLWRLPTGRLITAEAMLDKCRFHPATKLIFQPGGTPYVAVLCIQCRVITGQDSPADDGFDWRDFIDFATDHQCMPG